MKIRNGFVSNSSSSSFIVEKEKLTKSQIHMLLGYKDMEFNYDGWVIEEGEDCMIGWTHSDNGCIHEFLENIGISEKANIKWSSL